MPGRPLLYVVCAAMLGAFQPSAEAQTTTLTGAVEGRVSDPTGAALVGTRITLVSDAVMGSLSATAGADGAYRFGLLAPGLYRVSFAFAGFRTTGRSGVPVRAGGTTTVNMMLDVAVNEGVTVTAEVLKLDRRATTLVTAFDRGQLDHLPGSRTPDAVLSMTPSVQLDSSDVGGSGAMSAAHFSAYGTAGYNRPTLEGISLSGMNGYGIGLDYGSFEQVSVGAGAYGPEWPSPGVHLQFITKSGANRYSGSLYAGYESGGWQSRNIDAGQIARGAASSAAVPARDANQLLGYRDVSGDAGGFIRRDWLWWYASLRNQGTSARQIAFAPEPLRMALAAATGKITLKTGQLSRAIFFMQATGNSQPIRLDAFLRSANAVNLSQESTSNRTATSAVWKAQWNAILANKMFIDVLAGGFTARASDRPNGTSPRFEDVFAPLVTGGNRDWYQTLRSDQVTALLGYGFDGRSGRHDVTAGADLQSRVDSEAWNRAYPGDVLQVLRLGVPSEVYLFQTPSRADSGQRWYAAYGNDSWQLSRRATVNLGLRVDHFRIFLPAQNHPGGRFNAGPTSFAAVQNVAGWTVVAPRIAGSFDLLGDGRTFAKAGYGQYWLPPGTDLGFNVNPNSAIWWERYKWSDTNGDSVWNSGEESSLIERRGGETNVSIDPALKLAFVREVTARVERELPGGWQVQTGIVWRGERQQGGRQRANWPFDAFNVIKTIADPGPDNIPGTADDGRDITVYDLPAELIGQSATVIRNALYGDSDYWTLEAVAQRRAGARFSLLASFSHTWQHDQGGGYLGQPVRANEFPATPNDLINTDVGGRHVFTTWSVKVFATYEGPRRIMVAPVLRYQSGQPFGRTLTVPLASGAVRVLVEPIGTRRQDGVMVADLRVSRSFGQRRGRPITAFVEIYNLLNSNAAETVSWNTMDFLRPLAITPPRIARIGVQIGW